MALSKELKTKIINEYATKPGDTGSAEVQVAILTERALPHLQNPRDPECLSH